LRIGTGLVELAPDQIISTTTCNGQFPGPLLRFKEGPSVTADVFNDFPRGRRVSACLPA
jgi:FtsP/CotA-like multicopper oxidase with cupredoxin domain